MFPCNASYLLFELVKGPSVCKMLLPEYQINDVDEGLILFVICRVRFSILLGSDPPFLPVEMSGRNGRFSAESLFLTPGKSSKNNEQDFASFSFLAILTLGYSRVPNKRGGVRIIGGGWKWFNITIIGGLK